MSANFDQDGLDDFLSNIDSVSAQIKKIVSGDFDPNIVSDEEQRVLNKDRIKQAKKAREFQDHQDKILRGNPGKGQKETYVHWCRKCSVEYTLPCPKCFHCGQDCITYPERKKELDSLVDVYKVTKDRRAERKHKWDLWKKTKSIFWKKTATDYSKWEYFTDSEDELEEIEKNAKPIVPDHDPQFRAMEKDMDERNARQKVDRKKAKEFKDKANELMKKKDYFRAIELYSEALDLHKQNKYLWTNRALAYLKFNEPVKAEADCTRILEYSELFEDGYTKSPDANFKAFCRRAQAKLAQQNFEGSIEDIGEALKLYPTDQGGLELKAEIEAKTATHARLQEIETKFKGEDYTDEKYLHIKACILVIDTFLELNKHQKDESKMPGIIDFDYTALLMALEEHRDAKLYFFAKKGMDLIKQIVQRELYTPDFRAEKHNLFSFMQVVLQDDETFLEETKENGIVRVTVKNLSKLADQVFGKSTDDDSDPKAAGKENDQNTANSKKPEKSTIVDESKIYRTMEELFELLTACSMNSKVRLYLRDKHHLLVPIFAKVTNGLALKINAEYELYSSVLNLFSNLFIKETLETGNELKRLIVKDHSEILLKTFGNILKKTSNKFLTLKKSTCAFLANLMLEGEVRSGALRQLLLDIEHDSPELMDCVPFAYFLQSASADLAKGEKKFHTGDGKFDRYFAGYVENFLSMIINLCFKNTDERLKTRFKIWTSAYDLPDSILRILAKVLKQKDLIYTENAVKIQRILVVLAKMQILATEPSRVSYKGMFPFILAMFSEKAKEIGIIDDVIRFVAASFTEKDQTEFLQELLSKIAVESKSFKETIIGIIGTDYENAMRFCNTCTLCNNFLELEPRFLDEFKPMIGKLIVVLKDKSGIIRKSAAILLAKMCKDERNLEVARSLHGTELLMQLQSFILP